MMCPRPAWTSLRFILKLESSSATISLTLQFTKTNSGGILTKYIHLNPMKTWTSSSRPTDFYLQMRSNPTTKSSCKTNPNLTCNTAIAQSQNLSRKSKKIKGRRSLTSRNKSRSRKKQSTLRTKSKSRKEKNRWFINLNRKIKSKKRTSLLFRYSMLPSRQSKNLNQF